MPVEIPEIQVATTAEKNLDNWQRKLMPWLVILPSILSAAFILLATVRLQHFENFTFGDQQKVFTPPLPPPSDTGRGFTRSADYQRLYIMAMMEEHSINRRYSQAGIITMSTIYTKYLGFFMGMILAIVGSAFVISKLKEDATQLEGSYQENAKFKVVSSSPGLLFALLGTILMSLSILHKGEVKVDDMPLYLNAANFYISSQRTPRTGIDTTAIGHLTPRETKIVDSLIQSP